MGNVKEQVHDEIARRGLVSVMNDTKWRELQNAIATELPFRPAYQRKDVLNEQPQPEHFDTDVNYWGDWSDEALLPFVSIEWLRIRPQYLKSRGRLISPQNHNEEPQLLEVLARYQIPFRQENDSIWIFGYAG